MPLPKVICIITNAHSTGDVRLYHKIGRSLSKLGKVYVLGASGVGNRMDDHGLYPDRASALETDDKPVRIVVSGTTPLFRLYHLYRQALKLKPQAVICVEPLTLLAGLWLKKKLGCKLGYDAHEYYAESHAERYSPLLRPIIKSLYFLLEAGWQSKMDLTITVNRDLFHLFALSPYNRCLDKQRTGQATAIRKPGVVCPNYPTSAIWDDLNLCSSEGLLPDTRFDAVYLGGLTEERGILKLLKAIELLRQKRPHLTVLFIGRFKPEAFKERFFAYVLNNNLNSNVFWREPVSPDKVCSILHQAKLGLCVLNPALRRYRKALPLKVLEYLAAGLPVVANYFPVVREIVEKHKLGYCVGYQKQEIAAAMDNILALDEDRWKALSEHCRQVIRTNYVWEKVEPDLLAAVQAMLLS